MEQVLSLVNHSLNILFILLCLGLIIFFLFSGRNRPKINLRDIQAFHHIQREVDLAVEAGNQTPYFVGSGEY